MMIVDENALVSASVIDSLIPLTLHLSPVLLFSSTKPQALHNVTPQKNAGAHFSSWTRARALKMKKS